MNRILFHNKGLESPTLANEPICSFNSILKVETKIISELTQIYTF